MTDGGPSPIVVYDVDLMLPDGRNYFTTPDMVAWSRKDKSKGKPRPIYRTSEVAKIFFAREYGWLLKFVRTGFLTDENPETRWDPPPRNEADHREWRLWHVETLAYTLHENGLIDVGQLARTVKMVKLQAQNYGLLP